MNTEHNFIENEILIFSKETMDLFFKQENPAELIALYSFYYYTAKWQKTNQIKAAISYTAKGLKWGRDKTIKHKTMLIKLGLIEDVKRINPITKKVSGWYIRINYIWRQENAAKVIHNEQENHPTENQEGGEKIGLKSTPLVLPPVAKSDTNALSVNNRNALNTVNGVVKGFSENAGAAAPGAGAPRTAHSSPVIYAGPSLLPSLPDLDIEEGHKQYTIGEIRAVLGIDEEEKSLPYWQLVVSKIQPEVIMQILAEVRKEAIHRGKLFSYKVEHHIVTKRMSIKKPSMVNQPSMTTIA